MLGPKGRSSIHKRKTPQREGSQQEDSILENEKSVRRSESEEECEHGDCDAPTELSPSPQENKQNESTINENPASDIPFKFVRILPYLMVIIAVFVGIVVYFNQEKERSCPFENLEKEYPKETDFKCLQLGIELILNNKNEKPAVYLLAHRGKNNSDFLIDKIAHRSSDCFGSELIPMINDDFVQDSEDYGYAIEKYKSKIEKGNVLLIANLNKIPPKAARALHTICDTHSPIRKNVVIFLSLTIDENKEGNPHSKAEQTLEELWGSEMGRNELDPLITRVTDQVIILKS